MIYRHGQVSADGVEIGTLVATHYTADEAALRNVAVVLHYKYGVGVCVLTCENVVYLPYSVMPLIDDLFSRLTLCNVTVHVLL